jgi:hypothetical protein
MTHFNKVINKKYEKFFRDALCSERHQFWLGQA